MPLLQEKEYTVNDIYHLLDGVRAELINGRIYYMAPPSRIHQHILNYLSTEINLYIRKKNGVCEAYPAPFAVFLNRDDKTYVEPDISVIGDKNKLNDNGCNGAPDWVIEIVSPSSASHDYVVKLNKYMEAGVREYWIVNPEKKLITVYYFLEDDFSPYQFSFGDTIKVNIYDDLCIDFTKIEI